MYLSVNPLIYLHCPCRVLCACMYYDLLKHVCVPVRTELLSLAGKSIGKVDKNMRMAAPSPLSIPTPCRAECCSESALLGPASGLALSLCCRWWPCCGSSPPTARALWGSVSSRSSSPGSGTARSGWGGRLLSASVRSAQPQLPVPGSSPERRLDSWEV